MDRYDRFQQVGTWPAAAAAAVEDAGDVGDILKVSKCYSIYNEISLCPHRMDVRMTEIGALYLEWLMSAVSSGWMRIIDPHAEGARLLLLRRSRRGSGGAAPAIVTVRWND